MNPERIEELLGELQAALGVRLQSAEPAIGEVTIEVAAGDLLEAMTILRDDERLSFTQMSDLSGLDLLTYGRADWQTQSATNSGFSRGVAKGSVIESETDERRFAIVYQLLSVTKNRRLRVKCFPQGEPPTIASVTSIWPVADWYEREAFDLFGVLFDGHDDLRRLLTDYGFIGHPFRKDFPLEGHVEVRYDPDKQRVIYQPVSIEPRTLVPRVIRDDYPVPRGRLAPQPEADAEEASDDA
ncbi:MAG: NADH-quinone oxidoreductase subunit C [Pseudomonadota bacterium]